jgi:hypothetical protein
MPLARARHSSAWSRNSEAFFIRPPLTWAAPYRQVARESRIELERGAVLIVLTGTALIVQGLPQEGSTLRYRQLDHADVAAISRVHWRACLLAYAFMNWSYAEEEVQDWYVGKISGWDWGLVAEDDRIVGFVATAGARLDQLFVEPEHQGRGIGTKAADRRSCSNAAKRHANCL